MVEYFDSYSEKSLTLEQQKNIEQQRVIDKTKQQLEQYQKNVIVGWLITWLALVKWFFDWFGSSSETPQSSQSLSFQEEKNLTIIDADDDIAQADSWFVSSTSTSINHIHNHTTSSLKPKKTQPSHSQQHLWSLFDRVKQKALSTYQSAKDYISTWVDRIRRIVWFSVDRIRSFALEKSRGVTYCARTTYKNLTNIFGIRGLTRWNAYDMAKNKPGQWCVKRVGSVDVCWKDVADLVLINQPQGNVAQIYTNSGSKYGHTATAFFDEKHGGWFVLDPYVNGWSQKGVPLEEYQRSKKIIAVDLYQTDVQS